MKIKFKLRKVIALALTFAMIFSTSIVTTYAGGDEPETPICEIAVAVDKTVDPAGFVTVPLDGTKVAGGHVYVEDGTLVLDGYTYEGPGFPVSSYENAAIAIAGSIGVAIKGENNVKVTSEDGTTTIGLYIMPYYDSDAAHTNVDIYKKYGSQTSKLNITVSSKANDTYLKGIEANSSLSITECTTTVNVSGPNLVAGRGIYVSENAYFGYKGNINVNVDSICSNELKGDLCGLFAWGEISIDYQFTRVYINAGSGEQVTGICAKGGLSINSPSQVEVVAGKGEYVSIAAHVEDHFNVNRDDIESDFSYRFVSTAADGTAFYGETINPSGNVGYYVDIDDTFSGIPDTTERITQHNFLMPNAKSYIISNVDNSVHMDQLTYVNCDKAGFVSDTTPVVPNYELYYGDIRLEEGTDFLMKPMSTPSSIGQEGSLEFVGLGKYSGTFTKVYTVDYVYPIDSSVVILDEQEFIYTGSVIEPKVYVRDGMYTLEDNEYSVKYYSDKECTNPTTPIEPGKYYIKIAGQYDYTGEIVDSQNYIVILPNANNTVKANLTTKYSKTGAYNDIKVSWTKVHGADGYAVYYKKASAKSYTLLGKYTGLTCSKKDLAAGTKYTIKVVPYINDEEGSIIYAKGYKTATVTTLKKVATPTVVRSGSKVKVKWTNIDGESGYQISKSTKKSGTNIVSTYATTKGTYKLLKATKGKTYYYKVRAYKTVNGAKIFGPWSAVKAFKR